MDFSSFLTSLGTSFVIFLVLMFVFTWLSRRPGNHAVYYPNRLLKGLDPYEGLRLTRNPFAWIREAIVSTEADVIRMSGVDTAVYFVFLTTVLGILVLSGLILLPVLLPVAATAHGAMKANDTTSEGTFNDLDKLSMGHVEEGSPRLWAFVIATYWVSFVSYCLLWKAYKHVIELRSAALMSPEVKNEQFAVLVRDIPPVPMGQTRKEQVDSYFKAIYPDTFYRSLVVTDNTKVNKIYEELEGYRKKLARAEAIYAESKTTANPEGTRPTTKTGFLSLIGKKVDAIEYYDEKIKDLIPKLEAEQKVTLKDRQQCSAIILFNNRVTASAASQSLHDRMVDTWTVQDAPEPGQIIWVNLHKKFSERLIRKYVIYFIVFLAIFFYMIPIGFISALTTLDNLKKLLPFLKPVVDQPAIKTVLQAYLPQLALIVFLALLPKFLLFLSKAEGIPLESHAERAASGKYFYFSVLNVFIGVTVGSTLFSTLKKIEKHPNSAITLLAESLPGSATFFLTFVALKFFVGYGLELSRIVPLIIFHLKKKYLCKTEAELKEAWAPGGLGYATRIPGDMLIVTIVLCYSVIAPMIIPFGVLYFGLGWLVLRNQVLKVYVPSYESYGRMWPHIFIRIIASLILYQLTMLGYFLAKKFFYAPLLIPLIILSFIFAFICTKKFYRFFQSTALEVAAHGLKETANLEAIFRSFVPPSLSSDKGDEDQFEDALSQVSRTGSVV
ncbi:CSC1-like protein erd4 [Orobanche minor]